MKDASILIPFETNHIPAPAAWSRPILYILIATSALYLLQRYLAFPFSAESRALLYSLLVFIALGVERRLFSIPLLYWLLGAAVFGAGIHTYFRYDLHLAAHATARFSNVMLLAPVVSVLFFSDRHLVWVFRIFMSIFIMALASLLYQYGGGSMNTMVQGYVAIRADLVRHMTVVGEPNVGGMLAVIAFVISSLTIRSRAGSVAFSALAVAFVFLSLSKAAILGLPLAMLALLVLSNDRVRLVQNFAMALALGSAFLLVIGADGYLTNSLRSVFGGIAREPSAMQDFQNRIEINRFSIFDGPPLQVLGQLLFGASYGVAGSAAQEILGKNAGVVLPHNSYVELFMVGGAIMLGITIALMVRAFRNLALTANSPPCAMDRCALICLILLSCWMLVYPVIYEPVLGALFWTIIGYGNRVRHSNEMKTEETKV